MNKRIDPAEFNLPARTVLEEDQAGQLTLVLDRKSRIIMADGRNIVAKAERIRIKRSDQPINLRTTAPICSKTARYLTENNIKII
ncbi:MAG: hypothetical protein KAS94_05500 [Desulfobulbaceae bacterium]|nr:hypothetical protein [Desulfobulbaceae bacterium]